MKKPADCSAGFSAVGTLLLSGVGGSKGEADARASKRRDVGSALDVSVGAIDEQFDLEMDKVPRNRVGAWNFESERSKDAGR